MGGTGSLLVGQSTTQAFGYSVSTQASGIPAGGQYDREGRVDAALRTAPRGRATLPRVQEELLLSVNIPKTTTMKTRLNLCIN